MKQLFLYTTRRVFAPLIILVLTLPASVTIGFAAEQHGLSIYGAPRYPQDFKHFDYVNPNAPKGGVMTQGSFGTYDSLNPFILPGNSAAGLGLIYDTLMEKGQNEAFGEYGLLAKTIRVSPPGARNPSVTFNLHENAKFSDGKPVTAEDVVFTFNLLIKDGSPLYRSYYADVKSVRAVGKHRVVFYLANGENKELPLILGQLMVLPKHYWKDRDFTKVSLDIPIGSGPYRLAERNPGRSITYKRNPGYWGKDLPVNKGRHNFDEMRYVYYRDLSIVHEAFKAGKIDVKVENQANRWKTGYNFPAVKNGKVITKEFPHQRNQGMQAFVFNTRQPMLPRRECAKPSIMLLILNGQTKICFITATPDPTASIPTASWRHAACRRGRTEYLECLSRSVTAPVVYAAAAGYPQQRQGYFPFQSADRFENSCRRRLAIKGWQTDKSRQTDEN